MNALLSVWLQVAVLGLVALAIERVALRRAPAALRELLWTLVLLRLLLPAEWVALPGLPDGSGLSAFGAGLSAAGGGDAIAAGRAIDTWVIWTWAGGAAAFLLVGLRAHRSALRPLVADRRPPSPAWQRAARRAARRLGLGRSFELAATTARAAPCVSGWWRPTVHVPAAEPPGTSALDREHVLLHELAHVRRHDPLRAGLVLGVQTAFWFHPVVWLAAARLALARELGADARAASAAAAGPLAYGTTLLAWAGSVRPPLARPLAVASWVGGGRLRARIEALAIAPARAGISRTRRAAGTALAVAFAAASQLLLAAPAADRTPLPSSAAVAFTDDLRDLPGCLPRRYLVLSALAAAERADALADREPSPIR